eukprot:Platyproteum_vivax@DN5251_c0_g1_i2.p1
MYELQAFHLCNPQRSPSPSPVSRRLSPAVSFAHSIPVSARLSVDHGLYPCLDEELRSPKDNASVSKLDLQEASILNLIPQLNEQHLHSHQTSAPWQAEILYNISHQDSSANVLHRRMSNTTI